MRKEVLIIVCVILSGAGLLKAQSPDTMVYPLSTINHRAGICFIQLHDPYLSSLQYAGAGMRMEITAHRFINTDKGFSALIQLPKGRQSLSSLLRLSGVVAATKNPASTAAVNYLGGNLTWGVNYHYRKIDNMVVLLGAAVDGEFGVKQNSRNINNPVNMDIAFDVNAMLGVRYFIQTRKRSIQLNGAYEMPLAGLMFVPYPGLSYYELYSSGRIGEALFFSSLHNRQGNKLAVSVDFPLRTATLHAGWRFQHLKYQGSGPVFLRDEHALMLGVTYDVFRSSGRRSRFPANYIRSMY